MLLRVNQRLGTNWSLHDLRHSCALRMANDPNMPLVDVQTILGHARLTTTQDYLKPRLEEIVAHVRQHQARLTGERPPTPSAPLVGALGYDPEDLAALVGWQVAP